jgi:DNA-binding transcriptional MerR regulator
MDNDENISFDALLSDENSEWEILDGGIEGVTKLTPDVNTEVNEGEGSDGSDSPDNSGEDSPDTTKETSFEGEFEESEEEGSDSNEDEESEDADDDGELFDYLGKTLADKGILSLEEGVEIKSEDDIYKGIEETINKGITSWKNSLGEESLRYIDYIEKGGDPAKYIELNAATDYSSISLDTDDNKKEVISAYYKEKGFSEKKISRLIENAEDMEELSEEAEEAKSYFEKQKATAKESLLEAQRIENERRVAEQEKFTTNLEKYIEETQEIRNFPLNSKSQKQEIMDYIFKKDVPFRQNDGSVVKISQYMSDKIKRNQDTNSKLEDVIFDALVLKHGTAPISKKTLSDRNRKLADMAKQPKGS